jgi:glucose/arabinose dehydrogenase
VRRTHRIRSGLATAWLLVAVAGDAAAQLSIGGDPRVDPADFRVTVFASGLSYPTSMQQLEDGSYLVLTNIPNAGLFDSTGQLVRLVDADQDGVADSAPQVLYSGLPGIASSVRRIGDLVFVSSRELDNEGISVLRTGSQPSDALSLEGSLLFTFPNPAILNNHRNIAVAVRPHAGTGGDVDLLFNVGSEENAVATTETFTGEGLLLGVTGAATMNADSIYRAVLDDSGPNPVVTELVQIASGLRNAAGIAFRPGTDDLYFEDNGIDPSGVPQSTDELNRIASGAVGGAIEDFGFPSDTVEYRTGTVTTGLSNQPLVAFQPIPDPLTGAESEGPVELAFVSPGFPLALQNGLFVAFHGEFNQRGTGNGENPLVYVDLATLEYFHFVPNTDPNVGHANGLLATDDSLFVVDLGATTSLFGNSVSGTIHQIQSLNPPPVPGLAPLQVAAAAFLVALVGVLALMLAPATRPARPGMLG